jgi:chromosomal replication initiation ATPase DnaA
MDFKMRDDSQQIIKFAHEYNFKKEDFYISKSNIHILNLLNNWPKWEKNFLNISGERLSGKTHLVNIFLKKFKGFKIETQNLSNDTLRKIKIHENIILENLDESIDERLFFALLNIVDQDNKYLIVTTIKPIVNLKFKLIDLRSRLNNFLLFNIEKPDDDLIFALILKNLSDRQISLENKLIDFIIKRVDRSYSKIFDFIYKIDQISLKKKKSIDLKMIKEVLGE